MAFAPVINLSDLDGDNGFVISGIETYDRSGRSVSSAGDINGDGIGDVVIRAPYANESYVVFGGQDFGRSLNLADLDGSNGFVIEGFARGDRSDRSISTAGDINGDGFDDVIIGAFLADPNGNFDAGESYVVFGGQDFSRSLDLSELDGSNGFVINGIDRFDRSGISVSLAGDFNGDGIDDVIIGASAAAPNDNFRAGESYVVFGNQEFSSSLDLAQLNGSNGFIINGIDSGDNSGISVSTAGDFNGDGIDDVIIGASGADSSGNSSAGASYVVFGNQDFSRSLDLSELDGDNGFVISGIESDDFAGRSVGTAGDFNGDGIDDVIIGAPGASPNGNSDAGESYVVFGGQDFSRSLDLSELDGSNGFVINGIENDDFSGDSVSTAGDLNGDDIDDVIIKASSVGESYVVFGGQDFSRSLDLSELDGNNGFAIDGVFIRSASAAGDLNSDGIDDVIIGAPSASPNGIFSAGASYVVFGRQLDRPSLATRRTLTFSENTPFITTDIETTDNRDSEGNGLTYRLTGGADQAVFSINSSTGELSLSGVGVPDFENPNDFDRNNRYEVEVTVTDAEGFSDTGLFTVQITNVGRSLDLADLDGSNGFVISGFGDDVESRVSVSTAGDLNGDGFDDVIIGADRFDPDDPDGYARIGESYVVFGGQDFSRSLTVSELDGSNGFAINNINNDEYARIVVSNAGDINGDGIDDVIIGAPYADPDGSSGAGESYVVFGGQDFGSSFELSELDSDNGFVINGVDSFDLSGSSVSAAGDINGDGIDDVIIGAYQANPDGTINAGESYVVFGGQDFSSSFELSELNGSNGFVINGIDRFDSSGLSVSTAGDLNGDGIDDVIIGALGAAPNGTDDAGESYVVFGGQDFSFSLDLSELNGSNGFVINGIDEEDFSGVSVSTAGDFNGDGIDDVIIGAFSADPNGTDGAGESYVVFGGQDFSSSLNLSELDGSNGFVIKGIDRGDLSGRSVSNAGDINGDGIDDVIIGAYRAGPNSSRRAGASYVVFGGQDFGPSLDLSTLDSINGFVINGIDGGDYSGFSVSNAGDINGDGIDDAIIGANRADPSGFFDVGASYVVFGATLSSPTFNSDTDFTIPEQTTFVADLEATDDRDTENNGLIYRITDGADQSQFTIDALTGELSFITAPDFETPADADGDNIYEVEVSVTNSIDLSDTQLLNITVQDEDEGGTVPIFDIGIFDADTDTLIIPLEDNTEINASEIAGRNLTIAAFVPAASPLSGDIGSVFLDLNEGQITRRENVEPYALFGDIRGDFNGGELDFAIGENTLSLDVFAERNLQGDLVETVVREFTVVDGLANDVTVGLFDAATDTLIQTIEDGAIIEVTSGQNLTIAALIPEASVFFGQVESLFLDLNDGQITRTENVEPYALFGDIQGDFTIGSGVPPGDNTLTLDLFSGNQQSGEQLGTITRSFTFIDKNA